jgi:hypothetical protein
MKIDYAIVSTDGNNLYDGFWDLINPIWSKHIGIKPILVKISDKDLITDNGDHIIHEIKKIDGIDTGLQSQISRMYVTKFYEEKICLTSDIDMIPLSKNYFNENIDQYDQESLLIFTSNGYNGVDRYPICYNAGKGKLFSKILEINDSFEDYCNKLLSFGWGWETDELYFGLMIKKYLDQNNIIKLNRSWFNDSESTRIDRSNWSYNPEKVKSGEYIDSHSLRPYSQHKTEIDKLINKLI